MAELFLGAALLLEARHPPGFTRFVCHAVREIGNRLPEFIGGKIVEERLDYGKHISLIRTEWNEGGVDLDGWDAPLDDGQVPVNPPPTVTIPRGVVREVARLLKAHEEMPRERRPIRRMFMALSGDVGDEQLRPAEAEWLRVKQWFMDGTHESVTSPRHDSTFSLEEMQENFAAFERMLEALSTPPTPRLGALDALLEEANQQ